MSSKVRAVYYSARQGRYYAGPNVIARVADDLYNYGVSMTTIPSKYKRWEQVKWMFEHLPPKAQGKLFLLREPRRVKRGRSLYQSMISPLGITEKRWTAVRLAAYNIRQRQRQREAALQVAAARLQQRQATGRRGMQASVPVAAPPQPRQEPVIRFGTAQNPQFTTNDSWLDTWTTIQRAAEQRREQEATSPTQNNTVTSGLAGGGLQAARNVLLDLEEREQQEEELARRQREEDDRF